MMVDNKDAKVANVWREDTEGREWIVLVRDFND